MKFKDRKEFGKSLVDYCKERGLSDKEISVVLTNAGRQIKETIKQSKSK